MPSYRTTSLFHYTKTANNLFNILKSGKLIPNYCEEDLSSEFTIDFVWGIPMVCFCDIPILLAGDFLKNYGRYCVAFDKEWGKHKGCNPVQYVTNTKILLSVEHFISRITELLKYEEKYGVIELSETRGRFPESYLEKYKSFSRSLKLLNNLYLSDNKAYDNESKLYYLGFLKKYESEWMGKPYENYKENEWRYIIEETKSIKWLDKDEYKKWRGEVPSPKPQPSTALKRNSLKFEPTDIHHIILFEESEIPAFIRKIRTLKKIGDTVLDDDTKDILISKISSFERIKKDY